MATAVALVTVSCGWIGAEVPDFWITRPLRKIFEEIAAAWAARPSTA